jgi:hypothetical protein
VEFGDGGGDAKNPPRYVACRQAIRGLKFGPLWAAEIGESVYPHGLRSAKDAVEQAV